MPDGPILSQERDRHGAMQDIQTSDGSPPPHKNAALGALLNEAKVTRRDIAALVTAVRRNKGPESRQLLNEGTWDALSAVLVRRTTDTSATAMW